MQPTVAGRTITVILNVNPDWVYSILTRLHFAHGDTRFVRTAIESHQIERDVAVRFAEFLKAADRQGILRDLKASSESVTGFFVNGEAVIQDSERLVATIDGGFSWEDVVIEDEKMHEIIGGRRYLLAELSRRYKTAAASGGYKVMQVGDVHILFSYFVPVAIQLSKEIYAKTEMYWSTTTSKHITQFVPRKYGAMERPQEWFWKYVEDVLKQYDEDREEPLRVRCSQPGPFKEPPF